MSNEGDCRTAPATPGLLKFRCFKIIKTPAHVSTRLTHKGIWQMIENSNFLWAVCSFCCQSTKFHWIFLGQKVYKYIEMYIASVLVYTQGLKKVLLNISE